MLKNVLELRIPKPLADLIRACETVCVADCCGVDAYDQAPEVIAAWVRTAGVEAAHEAVQQARSLAGQVEQHDGDVSSYPLLNISWKSKRVADYLRAWANNTLKTVKVIESRASMGT